MAENVGEIYYEVDARTEKLVDSGRKATTSLDELQGAFDKTDKAADGTGKKLDKTGDSLSDLGKDARDAAGKVDGAGKSITAVGADAAGAKGKVDAVDRSIVTLGTDARNASGGLEKLNSGLGKVDSGSKKAGGSAMGFSAVLTPLAAAVAGVITINSLKQWGALAEQFTLLQSRIQRLTPDLATASTTYQTLLGVAAQTGQTMPATVKLWETLTSSLKSLGATNAEVLTLTGTLQKIGKIGGSSAEETANALRQLGQSLAGGTLRAEEYNSIVEQTPELIRQLASASGMSMGQFRQAMLDGKLTAQQLFDLLLERVPAVNAEFDKMPRSASDAGNAVSVAFGAALSKIDQALGASQKLARALDALAGNISNIAGNLTGQEKLNALLEDQADIQRQIDFQNQRTFGPSKARLQELIDLQGKNRDEIELTRKSMSAAVTTKSSTTRKAPVETTDGQKVIKDMAEQNAALRAEGVQRAQLLAVQKLGSSATAQEIALVKALAADSYNLAEAEKARNKAKTQGIADGKKAVTKAEQERKKALADQKKLDDQAFKGAEQNQKAFEKVGVELANVGKTARETAQDAAELSLNKYATPEQVTSIRAIAAALYDAKQAKQLLASVDPIAAQGISYADDVKALQDANAQKLISDQRYQELKHQLEVDNAEKMKALQEANFAAASKGNELLFASIDALSQGATQSIAGLLSGTASLNDALGGIANTVLQTVVGAFVQMGTDWVKQQIMMQAQASATTATQVAGIGTVAGVQAGATAAIAATTTTTAATTGAAVATSMAPAAGLSSIASFGSAAVIGGAALLGTMLLAKSFGGGRQYGGPVNANSAYRVNETGAPEIFNAANGRQYMMPNQAGHVVSNKDATAGGGGGAAPIVNVNNYSGQAATTRSRFSEADRRYIIDVVVGDQQGGGRISKSTNQITGTKRRGT